MPVTAAPLLLETAFINGTKAKMKAAEIQLYGINIDSISLPTGRIIACDPLLVEEYGHPFTQQFPNGKFPVQLSIAKLQDIERIAFARINFSNVPVVRWELALLEGQSPLPVGHPKSYGYVVDGGNGMFMDAGALDSYNKNDLNSFAGGLYSEMGKHRHYKWRFANFHFGNHNLVAFSSGFGDGNYSSYIGYDANNNPCRLVTDFELIDWQNQ